MDQFLKLFELKQPMGLSAGERLIVSSLLSSLQPDCSIEIGSENGGTSRVIAAHSQNLVCFDVDPRVETRLQDVSNIKTIIGRSDETLPTFISQCEAESKKIDFAFVDGDHSYEGVLSDLDNILGSNVFDSCVILIHDCLMPGSRQAFRESLQKTPLRCIGSTLDFSQGSLDTSKDSFKPAGGFGLIVTHPTKEAIPVLSAGLRMYFGDYLASEKSQNPSLAARVWRKLVTKKYEIKFG